MASTPFLVTLDAKVNSRRFRLIVQYDNADIQTPIEPVAMLYELSEDKSEVLESRKLSTPSGEPQPGWVLGAQMEAGKIISDIAGDHPVWAPHET
jgi:hypothetical protein